MTMELMSAIFTEEELVNSSASGRKCNANQNAVILPALNTAKVKAMKGKKIIIKII